MAKNKFKPLLLKDQTIIIIDSTVNGIGSATATLASAEGANVVITAASVHHLTNLPDHVVVLKGNVCNEAHLNRVREKALGAFGRIDTWINATSVPLMGYLLDGDIDEERRIFETNFWGTRLGSRVGIQAMQSHGGVLINLGAEVSTASTPLMGMYSASKDASKTITDSLRRELNDREIPVDVCHVRPSGQDDPMGCAEALLKCAVSPERDVYVGGPARLSAILDTFFPTLKDIYTETQMKSIRHSLKDASN